MAGLDLLSSLIKVAVVFGLLFVTLKVLAKQQGRGRRAGGRATRPTAALVEVLDQSRLGRSASVVTVRVGERAFLLGVTDEHVSSLAELTDDLDLTEPEDDDVERHSVLDHAVDLLKSGTFRR